MYILISVRGLGYWEAAPNSCLVSPCSGEIGLAMYTRKNPTGRKLVRVSLEREGGKVVVAIATPVNVEASACTPEDAGTLFTRSSDQ